MTRDLFRLVYCSRNTLCADQGDPAGEIARILTVSRINNARDGVTGALLYSDGCFAQVLEGDLGIVQHTFERIQRDSRHGSVIILEARRAETRMFGMWDMAFAEPSEPAKARSILSQALAEPTSEIGASVVTLLDGLVRRESDWINAA